MEKKLRLVGAILEIIAGTIWCMNALAGIITVHLLGYGVLIGFVQLVLSVLVTFSGVMFCAGQVFYKKASKEFNIFLNVFIIMICVIVQSLILYFSNMETAEGILAIGTSIIPIPILLLSSFFYYFCFSNNFQVKNMEKQDKKQND